MTLQGHMVSCFTVKAKDKISLYSTQDYFYHTSMHFQHSVPQYSKLGFHLYCHQLQLSNNYRMKKNPNMTCILT